MEGLGLMNGYWKDRRVFVTGATGMIGSCLVKQLLSEGSAVAVLVQDAQMSSDFYRAGFFKQVAIVNGSLEEYSTMERAINESEAQTVFHLGAQTIVGAAYRSPLATLESNVRGTYNVLEACRVHIETGVQVVVASSDKAYGAQPKLPYTEETPLAGRYPYEVSKSCADLIAQAYNHSYELPVAIARCGNVYGANDLNFSRIIPGTILSLLHGENPVIRSDGTFTRDYVYVRDIANAYMLLAERISETDVFGQAFNFSAEKPFTVLEVVAAIQDLMRLKSLEPIILGQATDEIKDQYLDSGRAKRVLGWGPAFNLEEGLRETISWYRDFFKASEAG